MISDDFENAHAIRFTGEGDVKACEVELKETRRERGVINISAMGGVAVPSGTGTSADRC
jgi:hypothetical protein